MTSAEGRLLTVLANALWQAPLLAAVAWAAAALLRFAPAAYRHRLWIATLALVVLAPAASVVGPADGVTPLVKPLRTRDGARAGVPDATAPGAGWTSKRLSLDAGPSAGWAGGAAAVGYVLFMLFRSVRLASAWRKTIRLVRGAEPAPAGLAAAARDAVASGPAVDLRVSGAIAAPLTFGIRRPVVVLPSSFAERVEPHDLRGVLVHELCHVARHDCAVNLLCELLALPVSFHPAVRLLRRRIAGAREAACDEAAAAAVGPSRYAQTLLGVAKLAVRPARLAGALGALDGDVLEDRMKRILEVKTTMGRRAATALLGVALATLAMAARGASVSAVTVTAEAGPSDMVGSWTGKMPGGQPAADLRIVLTPKGPAIALTLYRYQQRADGTTQADAVQLPVVDHGVDAGVLRFRTHVDDFRIRPSDPPASTDTDWEFSVSGKDAGVLSVVRNSKLDADRAQGKDVPPPPPPLPMARVDRR